jgi:two-component sensor histidine kinase
MKCILTILTILITHLSANEIEMRIYHYEDINKNSSLNDIKSKKFQLLKDNFLNRGLSKNKQWLKVEIKNHTSTPLNYLLELQNPTLDSIKLFKNNGSTIQTGDHYKFKSRDIDAINFVFNIDLKPNIKNIYYIEIKTDNAITIPIKLHQKETFFNSEISLNRGLYIFLGFILALIIYNSHLYLILKEKPYLYYVLFQLFYVGLLISMSGLGYSFLWQDNIVINEFTYKIFDDLALLFFMIFILSFLQTEKYFPSLHFKAKIALVLIVIVAVTEGFIHDILVKPVMLGAIGLISYIVILSVKKDILYAKYIFVGVSFLFIGSLSTLLKNFGWIGINFFTTWSIYIFVMLEAILFSIAIAKRIETIKEYDKELQLNQKTMLQKEVKRQTQKLQTLLQEVNHRVKNNLQIVSSFINISLQNSNEKKVLKALNSRIQTIALLHSSLYKSDIKVDINIKEYIQNIVENIYQIYDPNIKLHIDIEDTNLDFNRAIIIGLVVNEIVINTLTHAFKTDSKNPSIYIELCYKNNSYTLTIDDNGVGFNIDKEYKTLGLKLINRLVTKQLKGNLDIKSTKNGSSFKIRF